MLVTTKYKLFFSIFLFDFSEACTPAVEGETYTFRQIFKHDLDEPLELVWLRNSIPISTCRRNMACYDYRVDGTVTTLKSLRGIFFEAALTIKNATKVDAGTMNLKYLGLASLKRMEPLFTCKLHIYDFSALVLGDCPDVVEEETEVQCLCKKVDNMSDGFKLYWLDNSGNVRNNGNHLLSFIAGRDNLGNNCRGWRSDGVESKPLEYRPSIKKQGTSVENITIQQTMIYRSADTLTCVSFTLILVMMTFMIVTIFVCLRKDYLYDKLFSKILKRLEKGRSMRSPCQNLLLSPEDLYDRKLKPYSLLEITPIK